MQVGRTFGPTNGDQMQGGGGQQGPSNPIADAIRILSLQVPQNPGANSPTGVGMNTPSMMGGQMGSGLLLQWLRSLLGGGGQPGGQMPGGGGMPGGGMPGGRVQHALPGAMTPAFDFLHAAGQPWQPGQQTPGQPGQPGGSLKGGLSGGSFKGDVIAHKIPDGTQLPTPQAPWNGPGEVPQGFDRGGGNGINWAKGVNGPNPNPGMEGIFRAGMR